MNNINYDPPVSDLFMIRKYLECIPSDLKVRLSLYNHFDYSPNLGIAIKNVFVENLKAVNMNHVITGVRTVSFRYGLTKETRTLGDLIIIETDGYGDFAFGVEPINGYKSYSVITVIDDQRVEVAKISKAEVENEPIDDPVNDHNWTELYDGKIGIVTPIVVGNIPNDSEVTSDDADKVRYVTMTNTEISFLAKVLTFQVQKETEKVPKMLHEINVSDIKVYTRDNRFFKTVDGNEHIEIDYKYINAFPITLFMYGQHADNTSRDEDSDDDDYDDGNELDSDDDDGEDDDATLYLVALSLDGYNESIRVPRDIDISTVFPKLLYDGYKICFISRTSSFHNRYPYLSIWTNTTGYATSPNFDYEETTILDQTEGASAGVKTNIATAIKGVKDLPKNIIETYNKHMDKVRDIRDKFKKIETEKDFEQITDKHFDPTVTSLIGWAFTLPVAVIAVLFGGPFGILIGILLVTSKKVKGGDVIARKIRMIDSEVKILDRKIEIARRDDDTSDEFKLMRIKSILVNNQAKLKRVL